MQPVYSKIEMASRDELVSIQLSRLQSIVDYCIRKVPFYAKRLHEVGIESGSEIGCLADIEKIPFTTKEDLRDNYPDGFLAVPMKEVVRVHASSGTTGKPTVGYYTRKDMDTWSEAAARVLVQNGLTSDDIMQVSVGYGLFTGAFGFHQGAERIGCTIVPASTGNTQKQLVMLRDIGATVLMATPSYATYLSDLIANSETPRTEYRLRRVLLGAERCTEAMRRTIEENLGVPTADNYGLTECMGPGLAGECEFRRGLHISEDLFYPEIIAPGTGAVLPEGETGELVLTTLLREGMPLLRYRTRDLTSIDRTPCECGRTSARVKAPQSRVDDMFVFKGVNVCPSQVECALDSVKGLAPFYRIELARKDNRDYAKVKVELPHPKAEYSLTELDRLKMDLDYKLKEVVIVRMDIELVDPGAIERATGKSKRVEDLRYISE